MNLLGLKQSPGLQTGMKPNQNTTAFGNNWLSLVESLSCSLYFCAICLLLYFS